MKNITLRQAKVFIEIARTNSLTKAANNLFVTKGAISQTLTELETFLDVRLFERNKNKNHLTQDGKSIFPIINELIKKADDIECFFKKTQKKLFIGCTKTIGDFLLPDILSKFESEYGWLPDVNINNTKNIVDELENFNIDVALIETDFISDKLISYPWIMDELIIISSKENSLTKENTVTFPMLSKERWIIREEGSSCRNIFENQLLFFFDSSPEILTLNSINSILMSVENNLGLSFVSNKFKKNYFENIEKIKINKKFYRRFSVCHHKDKYISPILKKWFNFINNWKDENR